MIKKYKVQIDGRNVVKAPQVLVIANDPEAQVAQFLIKGQMSITDIVSSTFSALERSLEMFIDASQVPEEEVPALKRQVHDEVVKSFSFMMNRFDPTAVKDKWDGLNDMAVLKAQQDILKEKSEKLKKNSKTT